MSELVSQSDVILEIENTPVKCNKQELIRHSDYFKVMFEGNFIERDKKVIKLEGIDLRSMNIILSLLWDNSLIIDEDSITSVLQTSSMLQFVDIKAMCIQRLSQLLSPQNCIKTWLFAEQLDVKPLHLKAKNLALIEFNIIKDLESILELELKQLYNYLANTNLHCNSEFDVFQVCMKWWYENSGKLCKSIDTESMGSFRTETFLHLLSCLDFKGLKDLDLREMMTYPDLSDNMEITKIIRCIINLRRHSTIDCEEHVLDKSKRFFNSKSRSYKQLPCIVVHNIGDSIARKKQKMSSKSESLATVYYALSTDMFKRKRYYTSIDTSDQSLGIVYYDIATKNYINLLSIGKQKCENLHGFKVVGYKEFIFLFGGEYLLGNGHWNKNFWVYDTIREFWERKSVIPFVRRHFQTCVCGNNVYIVGGTANFRIIQDNMFWYNYKDDKWSTQIKLPCSGRQIKCCSWNNQLFLLNVNDKCGYLFDHCSLSWCKMNICNDLGLEFLFPDDGAIFSYKNRIYIKGDSLIEMKVFKQELVVTECIQLSTPKHDEIESIICENVVYSLYKHTCLEELTSPNSLSLEKYCMDSHTSEFIFKDVPEDTLVLEVGEYVFNMSTSIFAFQHYKLVATDSYINDF